MLDSSLKDLVARIRNGDDAAVNLFADHVSRVFFEEFINSKQVLAPFAEELAIKCIYNTIRTLITESDGDDEAIISHTIDQTFSDWFRTLQVDIHEASLLQHILFSKTAPIDIGLEIAARSRPLRPINGDLYDFISRPEDTLVVLVDASGKGTGAGIFAAIAGGFFRGYAAGTESPAELLALLDRAMAGAATGSKYLTVMLISWSPVLREISVAAAGFSPPLLSRAHVRHILHFEPGPPIGLELPIELPPEKYTEVCTTLTIGDWIAMFSDGIVDQINAADEEYGIKRLWDVIHKNENKPVDIIVDQVFTDLDRYVGSVARHDDQTLVLIRAVADH